MSTYELIQKLSKLDLLNYSLRKGVISLTIIDHKNIYEYYLDQKNQLKRNGERKYKMQALVNTCEKFECEKDKVYYAIKKMES